MAKPPPCEKLLHHGTDPNAREPETRLIELGADLEAEGQNGRAALAFAMMRGDREAIRRLHAAGAKGNKGWTVESVPEPADSSNFSASVGKLASSIQKGAPMIRVPDIAQTLDWYTSIGFMKSAGSGMAARSIGA